MHANESSGVARKSSNKNTSIPLAEKTSGEFINQDKGEETDEWALKQGYVSIVPTQFDLTAHHYIQELNNWNLNE